MYTQNEPLKIKSIEVLSIGTTETEVLVNHKTFAIQNQHESQILYMRDKADDSIAATSSNAYAIFPKETTMLFTAKKLSLIASAATTPVIIIYFD